MSSYQQAQFAQEDVDPFPDVCGCVINQEDGIRSLTVGCPSCGGSFKGPPCANCKGVKFVYIPCPHGATSTMAVTMSSPENSVALTHGSNRQAGGGSGSSGSRRTTTGNSGTPTRVKSSRHG